jgi:hypothetical protein
MAWPAPPAATAFAFSAKMRGRFENMSAGSTDFEGEEQMEKIFALAMLAGVILAIISAFVSVPMAAAALLILGGIGALDTANMPDLRLRIYAAAIILTLGAKSLEAIPAVGAALAAIFGSLALVFTGASIVGITLAVTQRLRTTLLK